MKMENNWTPAQSNAINAKNRNILVSAAAGSGKTAVLVERVKKLVTDKSNQIPLDSLLIVTFTNAAAAERVPHHPPPLRPARFPISRTGTPIPTLPPTSPLP